MGSVIEMKMRKKEIFLIANSMSFPLGKLSADFFFVSSTIFLHTRNRIKINVIPRMEASRELAMYQDVPSEFASQNTWLYAITHPMIEMEHVIDSVTLTFLNSFCFLTTKFEIWLKILNIPKNENKAQSEKIQFEIVSNTKSAGSLSAKVLSVCANFLWEKQFKF